MSETYAEKRRREMHEAVQRRREAGVVMKVIPDNSSDREWRRQIELMPRDTRDLTGVLMGDPIPNDPRRSLGA